MKPRDGLSAAFRDVPRPKSLSGCSRGCCITTDELVRLVASRDDPERPLALAYVDAAFVTAGTAGDFAYLLPGLLRLFAAELDVAESAYVQRFHTALVHARKGAGDVFMALGLPPAAAQAARDFVREALVARIGRERALAVRGSSATHAWPGFVASHGAYANDTPALVATLLDASSPGLAVALVQYASTLAFEANENPIFAPWTPKRGGGPPSLSEQDSLTSAPWLDENLVSFATVMTAEHLRERVLAARERLEDGAAREVAQRVADALAADADGAARRIATLLEELERPRH